MMYNDFTPGRQSPKDHDTSESFLSKAAFESDFRKKTFRCVIGLTLRRLSMLVHVG